MVPQPAPLLPLVVATVRLQWAADLGCCVDTDTQAVQEGAPLQASHSAAGCSPPDAPIQTYLKYDWGSEDLRKCLGGGGLGTPGRFERSTKTFTTVRVDTCAQVLLSPFDRMIVNTTAKTVNDVHLLKQLRYHHLKNSHHSMIYHLNVIWF